jgi:hypothetical protein
MCWAAAAGRRRLLGVWSVVSLLVLPQQQQCHAPSSAAAAAAAHHTPGSSNNNNSSATNNFVESDVVPPIESDGRCPAFGALREVTSLVTASELVGATPFVLRNYSRGSCTDGSSGTSLWRQQQQQLHSDAAIIEAVRSQGRGERAVVQILPGPRFGDVDYSGPSEPDETLGRALQRQAYASFRPALSVPRTTTANSEACMHAGS